MAKEDFFSSVRTAVGTVLPRVDADHPYTKKEDLEEVLRRQTDFWLSKEAVEGFDSGDFEDLDRETREALDRNIAAFLEVASKVDSRKPATRDQVDAALPPFLDVATIVRTTLLDEWLKAARQVTDQADRWAEGQGWPTKRYPWTFTERFLGTYEMDRLIFAVAGSQMALIPVGRFVMGSTGSFDLAVMPAYESVSVSRRKKAWFIRPLPGENASRRWSQSAFVETSEKLSRMG